MKSLTISKNKVVAEYNSATVSEKELLERLFGKSEFAFDYRSIKSYEDACARNGREPITDWGDRTKDEIAYVKLKEIAKAINNDPEFPRFTKDERRYFPYFFLYTKEEVNEMSEEDKSRVVFRSCYNAYSYGCVSNAYAIHDSSIANSSIGSRLAFRESERAKYCGEEFIELWADYVFKTE